MGTRAPMPRWYDIPVVWLGLQVLVMAGFLAAVRWLIPDFERCSIHDRLRGRARCHRSRRVSTQTLPGRTRRAEVGLESSRVEVSYEGAAYA